MLESLLLEHKAETVVDVAAGTGVDSVFLLEAGFHVTSIDLSEEMLRQAREVKKARIGEPAFREWQIGRGNWLDLDHIEEDTVVHPDQGYDAVICIGNSFAHLPDSTADQDDHKLAISNFYKLLRPGGILIIDHRNYDYILKHGTIPNTASKLYYQGGERIRKISTSLNLEEERVSQVTLHYEIDMSEIADGSEVLVRKEDGVDIPVLHFSLSYFPHTLDQFGKLLKRVFGEKAEHSILEDFKRESEEGSIPSYFVHVIKKSAR